MRLLTVGFDGGDKEIFDIFEMPFTKSLFKKGVNLTLKEDLISRGWAHILTGKHGCDNMGLYKSPVFNGSSDFVIKFGLNEMTENKNIVPVWKMLNDKNKSIGMMNIPTTKPAPEVKGFIVSGGGGGIGKIDGIPDEYYYPQSVITTLSKNDYIFDLRVNKANINDFNELVDSFNEIIKKRTKTYLELCSEYNPDFGFLCFRVTTGLQYLARHEIAEVADNLKNGMPLSGMHKKICQHYELIDNCLSEVFEKCKPEKFILTSDHGTAPYLQNVNVDNFLLKNGFLFKGSSSKSNNRNMLKQINKLLPEFIKNRLTKKIEDIIKKSFPRFEVKSTKAFGVYHVPGIYINDHKRFNGPLKHEDEIERQVDEICNVFNENDLAKTNDMKAIPYRRNYKNTYYYDGLPDIRIVTSDTIFFVVDGPFISKNNNYGTLTDDITKAENPFSGVKGSRPLLCVDKVTANLIQDEDPMDLRIVYNLIERIFS